MKFFIVLLAIVAVASAGYHVPVHHAPHVIHVAGQPAIPAPHAAPLAIKGYDHTTRIHYHAPHVGHPHLVGVEHYNAAPHFEPSVTNVHVGHGHGHGW